VAYVVDPREDSTDVVADHAYWLSELTVRDPQTSATGTIEVHSSGFGRGGTEPRSVAAGGGALTGGNLQALAYVERGLARTEAPSAGTADRLEITATNVGHVTIDPTRARVSCDAEVVIDSDGPIDVVLAGCPDGHTAGAPAGGESGPPPARPGSAPTLPVTGGGASPWAFLLVGVAVAVAGRRGRGGSSL
jgi:hypothetical protein